MVFACLYSLFLIQYFCFSNRNEILYNSVVLNYCCLNPYLDNIGSRASKWFLFNSRLPFTKWLNVLLGKFASFSKQRKERQGLSFNHSFITLQINWFIISCNYLAILLIYFLYKVVSIIVFYL